MKYVVTFSKYSIKLSDDVPVFDPFTFFSGYLNKLIFLLDLEVARRLFRFSQKFSSDKAVTWHGSQIPDVKNHFEVVGQRVQHKIDALPTGVGIAVFNKILLEKATNECWNKLFRFEGDFDIFNKDYASRNSRMHKIFQKFYDQDFPTEDKFFEVKALKGIGMW